MAASYNISSLSAHFTLASTDASLTVLPTDMGLALVQPPVMFTSIYTGGSSPHLSLSLSSPPVSGLMIKPYTVNTRARDGGDLIFDPAVLNFGSGEMHQSFRVDAREMSKASRFNVTFNVSGVDADSYSIVSNGSATLVAVHTARQFTVTFLTENGDVPAIEGSSDMLTDTVSGGAMGSGQLLTVSNGKQSLSLSSVRGTTEDSECSDRGLCDRYTGQCLCYDGYRSSDGNGERGERGDCGYLINTEMPVDT